MTTERHGREAAEIRASALAVLDYILKLELTKARWERLAAIIEVAIAAEAAGDLDGLRQATAELELAGPVRVVRIGGDPVVLPPPQVRERMDDLRDLMRNADAERDEDGE
jgi:hypothetical protein